MAESESNPVDLAGQIRKVSLSARLGNPSPPLTPVGQAPKIPDHELIRSIGRGSYGEVWMARNLMGTWRAVKVVYRSTFEDVRPYEREFEGIRRFEPISRTHDSQVDILHIGRNDHEGYFYYVMELADPGNAGTLSAPGTMDQGISAPLTHELAEPIMARFFEGTGRSFSQINARHGTSPLRQ